MRHAFWRGPWSPHDHTLDSASRPRRAAVRYAGCLLATFVSLADRVWRIVRGDSKWCHPLSSRRWAILLLLALSMLGAAGSARIFGFVGRAMADESADAPLPGITPAQLAAKIHEAMGRYDGKGLFRIVFTDTTDTNFNSDKPIMVSYRGRARYEGDGTRWRAEFDSKMPTSGTTRLWPDRWSTGFDGTQPYDWHVSRNEFILGESSFLANQWTPRALIWEKTEEMVAVLEENNRDKFKIMITQKVVDGKRCYVIASKSANGEWGNETIISPRQGHLPIERKWTHLGKIYSSHKVQGVHEVIPGIWAPERMENESIGIRADGSSQLILRRRMQIVEFRPRDVPPPNTFAFEMPYGVDVTDRRSGSSYHNDPWWPEVGPMLREKFGWPPPDFSPLATLGSPSKNTLDEKTAPPLQVASWLNSKPLDLVRRGKVVLLEFWNVSAQFRSPIVPALRELYKVYHPAGLEIIAVHAPTRDPNELRRFIRDYGIEYPVAIDGPEPAHWGTTADRYGTRGGTYAYLIDHEGKVHSVVEPTANDGKIVETIMSLLKRSGVRDVKPVSLETPRLPDPALNAIEVLFKTIAKEALDADPKGKILGRIVDGDNQRRFSRPLNLPN